MVDSAAAPGGGGNSTILLEAVKEGVLAGGGEWAQYDTERMNLKSCRGCLRCNLFRRCVIKGDDWTDLSAEILAADGLVFASPVYFHHVTSSMKKLLDRFRSFIHVQITETGLIHTPWVEWEKRFVLLMTLGAPTEEDAEPVKTLFSFIGETLGEGNRLETLIATRLATAGQIRFSLKELEELYPKLKLPVELAEGDWRRNRDALEKAYKLGLGLARGRERMSRDKLSWPCFPLEKGFSRGHY